MLNSLLAISDYGEFIIPAILGIIIWYFLLRSAVRADSIVKNQELMIHLMIQQFKKQGATDEEIQNLKAHFKIK